MALISNLAQMSGIHPTAPDVVDDDSTRPDIVEVDEEDEVFDVLALAEKRKQAEAERKMAKEKSDYEDMLAKKKAKEEELAAIEAAELHQRIEVHNQKQIQLQEEKKRKQEVKFVQICDRLIEYSYIIYIYI